MDKNEPPTMESSLSYHIWPSRLDVLRDIKLGKNVASSLKIVEKIVGKTLLAALGVDGCWALFKRLVG